MARWLARDDLTENIDVKTFWDRHIKQIKENNGWRTEGTRDGYGRWR